MTRHPSEKSVSFDDLADLYGADDFQDALADFIVKHNFPHLSSRAAQTQANNTLIPFRSVSVYNKIKFYITTRGSNQGSQETFDSVHSRPSRLDKQERVVPARFDTVLVKIPGNARGINKFRVAQVRTVFSISPLAAAEIFHSSVSDQPRHLAYVEWFTPFTPLPDRDCGMYRVSRSFNTGKRLASIIQLKQSVVVFISILDSVHQLRETGRATMF